MIVTISPPDHLTNMYFGSESAGRSDGAVRVAGATWPLPRSCSTRTWAPAGGATDPRERFTHLELSPYTRMCETLRAAIDGHPAPSPVAAATFADGVAEMAVLDAIRTSAAAGGSLVPVQPT